MMYITKWKYSTCNRTRAGIHIGVSNFHKYLKNELLTEIRYAMVIAFAGSKKRKEKTKESRKMDSLLKIIFLLSEEQKMASVWASAQLTLQKYASFHIELCLEECQRSFWQINTFWVSTPSSVSSLRHTHLILLAMAPILSTNCLDSRKKAYPFGLKIRSISKRTYFISHLQHEHASNCQVRSTRNVA